MNQVLSIFLYYPCSFVLFFSSLYQDDALFSIQDLQLQCAVKAVPGTLESHSSASDPKAVTECMSAIPQIFHRKRQNPDWQERPNSDMLLIYLKSIFKSSNTHREPNGEQYILTCVLSVLGFFLYMIPNFWRFLRLTISLHQAKILSSL